MLSKRFHSAKYKLQETHTYDDFIKDFRIPVNKKTQAFIEPELLDLHSSIVESIMFNKHNYPELI
ncbi:hypothetical protein DZ860_11865 [Vibrio sinensis]|uniref:Uncharacterized protein n=1 Tax=Vibrio sinensis TaxID=2302434 RepID=A0A3A6QJC6_9VIBR|nr:hypothetical protein DZ860_11865 [Vibrio sinensis]